MEKGNVQKQIRLGFGASLIGMGKLLLSRLKYNPLNP